MDIMVRQASLWEEPRDAGAAPQRHSFAKLPPAIDDFQGMGLGKRMLGRLAAAAWTGGVERLRALIVPDSAPVLGLLRKYAPGA